MIYTLVGFMAAGKSTVGRLLASNIGAQFIDLDEFIVSSMGESIASVFASKGEAAFREIEFECLEKVVNSCDDGKALVIALGGGTFIYEKSRTLVLEKTTSIYLYSDLSEILSRLSADRGQRPLASNAEALFAYREPFYRLSSMTVSTEGKSPDDIASLISSAIFYR